MKQKITTGVGTMVQWGYYMLKQHHFDIPFKSFGLSSMVFIASQYKQAVIVLQYNNN